MHCLRLQPCGSHNNRRGNQRGLGEVAAPKHYLKPHIMFYKDFIVGEDPTDVERVMMRIRKGGVVLSRGAAQ